MRNLGKNTERDLEKKSKKTRKRGLSCLRQEVNCCCIRGVFLFHICKPSDAHFLSLALPIPLSVGPLRVEFSEPVNLDMVRKDNPQLVIGGRYKPSNCVALQKVAIIIPFRNRDEHLNYWLLFLHPILQRQQLDYGIYVIQQVQLSNYLLTCTLHRWQSRVEKRYPDLRNTHFVHESIHAHSSELKSIHDLTTQPFNRSTHY